MKNKSSGNFEFYCENLYCLLSELIDDWNLLGNSKFLNSLEQNRIPKISSCPTLSIECYKNQKFSYHVQASTIKIAKCTKIQTMV